MIKSSSTPTAIATPAGCLATNAAVFFVFSAALAATLRVRSAAPLIPFSVLRASFAYCRLIFCFCQNREAAKAEKAAFRANVDFQYHKTLHENPQLTSNPISRLWLPPCGCVLPRP